MRSIPSLAALALLGACAGAPDTDPDGVANAVGSAATSGAEPFVLRSWTAACGLGAVPRCEAAATAWQWRELRAAVPELATCELACAFGSERFVAVVVPQAGLAPPVSCVHHREEDVDVLELTPTPARPEDRGVVHVMVVPVTGAPLAVVLRPPAADGRTLERTLGAFPAAPGR